MTVRSTSTTGSIKTDILSNNDLQISALAANVSLLGGNAVSNTFYPGAAGGHQVYGGKGADTVVYDAPYSNFTITPVYSGKTATSYTVADGVTHAAADTINANVDYLSFGNGSTVVSLDNGKVTAIPLSSEKSFSGSLADYSITKVGANFIVQDLVRGSDRVLVLGANNLSFADMTVNLGVQAQVAATAPATVQSVMELYIAFFARVPDADGLSYWLSQVKGGQTVNQVADTFYGIGAQYTALTGFSATMSNDSFINIIYRNVLGRADGADAGGLAHWNAELSSGRATRGSLVSSILYAAHSFKGDATYGYVADLLDNRIAVATTFTTTLGLGYASSDVSITKGMAISAAVTPTDTSAALALIGVAPANFHLGY